MIRHQSLFERLTECGMQPYQIQEISEEIGVRWLAGKGALLTIEHACPCKHCGGKDHAVFFILKDKLGPKLRRLLTQGGRRPKKEP